MTNEELIQKAIITTDALAVSGKLSPAQSDKFIDYIVDESVLRKVSRIIRFRNESLDIDKISLGRRVAMPKVEAQDPGLRRGITTSKVTLTPREIIVPFEIGENFLEIAIEPGADLEDHIVRMMATQLANNLEELAVNGDTLGHAILEEDYRDGGSATQYVKDGYLALHDGWFKLAAGGNVHDAEGANIGLSVFNAMLRQMPTKFRRNKADLRWFISPDLAQIYLEKLMSRATGLGDATAGGASHDPLGIPMVEVPLLEFLPPIVEHVVLTGTTPAALAYAPVASVVVTTSTLGTTPENAYVEVTDYVVDYTLGTIARSGGASAIGSGDTVKVTYTANPQVVLTHRANFLTGIGRDIKIARDEDIFKLTKQYAIHCKVAVEFEEDTALVKGINIGQGV